MTRCLSHRTRRMLLGGVAQTALPQAVSRAVDVPLASCRVFPPHQTPDSRTTAIYSPRGRAPLLLNAFYHWVIRQSANIPSATSQGPPGTLSSPFLL